MRRARSKEGKIRRDPELKEFIQQHLDRRWSPEQISQVLRCAVPDEPDRHLTDAADRIAIGETLITCLADGFGAHNPDSMMPGVDWAAHPGSLEDGQLVLTFGSFLIRTGGRKILVDLALGDMDADIPGLAHVKGGRLLESLVAEGLSPDDIDMVVYTHLHLDHIGWTSDVAPAPNGPEKKAPSRLTFAWARHLMAEAE